MEYPAQVFVRPQESPVYTTGGNNLRINYNGQWVDFRDGKVIVSPEQNSCNPESEE